MPGDREEDNGCGTMKIIELHDVKTLLGPCMISFSLPIMVPGVVLTVVGSYGNENTFPTFGGWHITGIIILSIAVILLTCGIVFKCLFKPTISPDIEKCLTPSNSVYAGSSNLGFEREKGLETVNGIYRGGNAHRNTGRGLHRVVSTHEIADKSGSRKQTRESNGQAGGVRAANTNKHRRGEGTSTLVEDTKENAKVTRHSPSNTHTTDRRNASDSDTNGRSRHKTRRAKAPDHNEVRSETEVSDTAGVTELRGSPPTYHNAVTMTPIKRLRRKDQSKDEGSSTNAQSENNTKSRKLRHRHGDEHPKHSVTASVVAEAEGEVQSTSGTQSRDPSSEPNETSEFLPEKKRKRKKRRRRHRSSQHSGSYTNEESADLEHTSDELPKHAAFQDPESSEFALEIEKQTTPEPEIDNTVRAKDAVSSKEKRISKRVTNHDDSESEYVSRNTVAIDDQATNELPELRGKRAHSNLENMQFSGAQQTAVLTAAPDPTDLYPHMRSHDAWSTPINITSDYSGPNTQYSKSPPYEIAMQSTNISDLSVEPTPTTQTICNSNSGNSTFETNA